LPTEEDPDEYGVLDLATAYARAEACDYFQGYLTSISDVRRLNISPADAPAFLRAHVGLFSVDEIDDSACTERASFYLQQLGLFRTDASIILPSPELLCLYDLGVRFRIRAGAWGLPLPSIDWAACNLLEHGVGPFFSGVARYKVWCGQLGHTNHGIRRVWFPGTAQWAAYLRSRGHNALYFDSDGDILVQRPAKRSPSNHQLFAFITSYTRIHVLQKLMETPPEWVRGVQLDGIVYAGPVPLAVQTHGWRVKDNVSADILGSYSADGWYAVDRGHDDRWITALMSPLTGALHFLEGAGGSGKSHSILDDAGFRDVLFAAPMWSLVCFMARKYKRAGTTVHRLAGEYIDEETGKSIKCRAYHDEQGKFPAVVFVDEATMIDSTMLRAVIETYKGRSKLFIAGDIRVTGVPASKPPIWFQCRNRTSVFDPRSHDCAIVSYDGDFRASGPLVALKQALREVMVQTFLDSTAEDPGDDVVDAHTVSQPVQDLFADNVCTTATCAAEYLAGDTILVGTHELAAGWTDMLKDRDTRYRVVRHTLADVAAAQAGEDVLLTGDITTRNVPNAQFCLAFTIHSFQGKTFTGRRLWIDARRVWDYAMLYTAISRCRSLEQIRIMFE
jgi:hypothetical protein